MPSFLDLLDEGDRREFIKLARRRSFAAGDTVFWQGDVGDAIHIVAAGSFLVSVSTPLAQTIVLNVYQRGDMFGELALVSTDQRRSASVAALERSETLSLTMDDFNEWRLREPHIDRYLITALADRVRELTEQMLESHYLPVEALVARRILTLHDALARQSQDGWMRIRQQELASFCAITRPTVNRVMRQFADERLIELARGRLRVPDITKLARRAGNTPLL